MRSKETSAVANSTAHSSDHLTVSELFDGSVQASFYRLMRKAYWAWQGQDPLTTEALLSRIAASNTKRTNNELIDTVCGYQSGNWIYEWNQLSSKSYNKATNALNSGDKEQARSLFLEASRTASIASYPHLKGDRMAEQSQVLAGKYYQEAGKLLSPSLKVIDIPFNKKSVKAYLHLPFTDKPAPVVIVSGGVDSLQVDFYRLFTDYLKPQGLAMLTLDMPGIGSSSHIPLEQDTSILHQAALNYLPQVPWVDQFKVGIIGSRLGGNIAVRLAYLEPSKLKAAVSIGGAVHSIFHDLERFNRLPRMLKDSLASRLGVDASNIKYLFEKCQPLSLKRQGLLGSSKTKLPLLSIAADNDLICPNKDQKLIANASYQGEMLQIKETQVFDLYHKALQKSAQWLALHLG